MHDALEGEADLKTGTLHNNLLLAHYPDKNLRISLHPLPSARWRDEASRCVVGNGFVSGFVFGSVTYCCNAGYFIKNFYRRTRRRRASTTAAGKQSGDSRVRDPDRAGQLVVRQHEADSPFST